MRLPFMSKTERPVDIAKIAEQMRDPVLHALLRKASRQVKVDVHTISEYPLAGAGLPIGPVDNLEGEDPRAADFVSAFDDARSNPLTSPDMDIILSVSVSGEHILDLNYDKYGRFKDGVLHDGEHSQKFIGKLKELSEIRQSFEREHFGLFAKHLGLIGEEARVNAALQANGARQRLRVSLDQTCIASLSDGHAISSAKHVYGMVKHDFGPEPFRIALRQIETQGIDHVIENYMKKSEDAPSPAEEDISPQP